MHILIVEDSKIMQATLRSHVAKWGFQISCAASGEEAWDIIITQKPQILLTDWMLPGMDGPSLCRKIRTESDLPYIYIIIVTSLEDTASLVTGMQAGADDFIRKPINFSELHVRISAGERILELQQTLQTQNQHLKHLSEELRSAHTQLQSELVLAGDMQKKLLPPGQARIHGIDFESLYVPSLHVSGDLLNFFSLDDDNVCFYAIDVAGHGVSAAMMAFTLSWLLNPNMNENSPLKIKTASGQYLADAPANAVSELNRQFQNENDDLLYFTMLYGVLNNRERSLSFCQAGHPRPIYISKDQAVRFIGDGGFPVGLLTQAEYDTITISYQSGDYFFLYSDGVTECKNPQGELFGEQRLLNFFIDQQLHNGLGRPDRDLTSMLGELQQRLKQWSDGEDFDDDITILALKLN